VLTKNKNVPRADIKTVKTNKILHNKNDQQLINLSCYDGKQPLIALITF
jgi:hypothetical protein